MKYIRHNNNNNNNNNNHNNNNNNNTKIIIGDTLRTKQELRHSPFAKTISDCTYIKASAVSNFVS